MASRSQEHRSQEDRSKEDRYQEHRSQEDRYQEGGFIDPRLLELTGGAQAVASEVPVQAHLDNTAEFDREVDDSLLPGHGHNPNDVHDMQLDKPHDSFYPISSPPHPYHHGQLPSTPIGRNAHQRGGNLPTPARSMDTPYSNLDPQAPPFSPGNIQWPQNMPMTPSSLTPSRAHHDPFASLGFHRAHQNDLAEGQVPYEEPIDSHACPSHRSARSRSGNGILSSTASHPSSTLQQYSRSSQVPAINVSGWSRVGIAPSHDIPTWLKESYTVPGSTLPRPHNSAPIRQGRRARTSVSRPGSSAGRSHGTGSFVCLSEGCGRTFDKRGNLNKHARCHQPGRFECGECEKKFSYMKDLLRHMRTHTGEKPFKCPEEGCLYYEQGFSKKDNRDRHVASQHQHRAAPGTPMTGMSV